MRRLHQEWRHIVLEVGLKSMSVAYWRNIIKVAMYYQCQAMYVFAEFHIGENVNTRGFDDSFFHYYVRARSDGTLKNEPDNRSCRVRGQKDTRATAYRLSIQNYIEPTVIQLLNQELISYSDVKQHFRIRRLLFIIPISCILISQNVHSQNLGNHL